MFSLELQKSVSAVSTPPGQGIAVLAALLQQLGKTVPRIALGQLAIDLT